MTISKENHQSPDLNEIEYELNKEAIDKAISLMEEMDINHDNLLLIQKKIYDLDMNSIPYKIYMTKSGAIWAHILYDKVTKH